MCVCVRACVINYRGFRMIVGYNSLNFIIALCDLYIGCNDFFIS